MWVSRYFVWFVVYSVLGWVYESAYCTAHDHRWENRGFLYGPLCPIYGIGTTAIFAAWSHALAAGLAPGPVRIFIYVALGSAVLEYATSWLLELLFHARWWDYRNMPLNLNGRICVPATVLFGLAGLLLCYGLYEPTVKITNGLSPAAIEALSLLFASTVSADLALTVSSLTRFARVAKAIDKSVNDHMERFVQEAGARGSLARDAMLAERDRFAASLRTSRLAAMSNPVRAAAGRARTYATQSAANAPDELRRLWEELRQQVRR